MMTIERISLELSRRCKKACWFCYNGSDASGESAWSEADALAFLNDCAAFGVKAVSFGGGEPLEDSRVLSLLSSTRGVLFRSLTTNGLPLESPPTFEALVRAAPEKVHVSIHFPDRRAEVIRVVRQVQELASAGIASGVNLLVRRSQLESAKQATNELRDAGIDTRRIVFLPMRGSDTPTPEQVADVAGGSPFASMSCLTGCAKSPRFCTIGWDRTVAWCSYTSTRAPLRAQSHRARRGARCPRPDLLRWAVASR
jgi:MoaA/NifB/PqqE/SkfB family radical SAM enzyme